MLRAYREGGNTVFIIGSQRNRKAGVLDRSAQVCLGIALEKGHLPSKILEHAEHEDLFYVARYGSQKARMAVFEEALDRAALGVLPPENKPYSSYAGFLALHHAMFSSVHSGQQH